MQEAILIATQGWQTLRWYGLAIAAVVLAIRWLRKPIVQDLIGMITPQLCWFAWPSEVRKACVFAVSLGASFLAAMVAGQGILISLVASIPVAISAIVTHKTTKAIGHAQTRRALKKNPDYRKPGGIRTSLDFLGVLPVDHKSIKKITP
jgi:hypothetical protein